MERGDDMKICARAGCHKIIGLRAPSPDFCSDNCTVAWTADHWGIDQFPIPSHDHYPRSRHPKDEPLPWLEGGS